MPILSRNFWLQMFPVLILFLALPLSIKISNGAIGISLLLSIAGVWNRKTLPTIKVFWFLPVLFIYYSLSEFLSGGVWYSMEKRLLFLIVPLLFMLNPEFSRKENKTKIYLSFIVGTLISFILCLIRATVRSTLYQDGILSFNSRIEKGEDYGFLTSSVMGGNYFFGKEFSQFMHPTYSALFVVLAQYLIFETVRSSENKRGNRLLIGCYFVFFGALFLLSSKAAIITSLILLTGISTYLLFKTHFNVWIKIAVLTSLIVISGSFILLNPRLKVFEETFTRELTINPNARFGHDLRMLSWDASLDVISQHLLFGVGEGRKESALIDVYTKKKYIVPAQERFNSHNQYFDFLLGGGIFYLTLFMTGLAQLFFLAIRGKNYPMLVFLLMFSFNALFENLLSVHIGILMFSVFITFWNSGNGANTNYSWRNGDTITSK